MSLLNFVLGVFLLTVLVEGHDKVVVCYYGTWATYRSGDGKFDVANIDTSLCTHLVYTFVGIQDNGTVVSLDPFLDLADNSGRDNFNKFNALKQQNANLKTILAVGGWNEGSAKYSTMAASSTLRKTFITSARDMVLKYGFNGLDIDWEYPNQRDSTQGAADVNNFSLLLKELKAEFDKYGLLVTVAVAAVKKSASLSYDIPTMSQNSCRVHPGRYLRLTGLDIDWEYPNQRDSTQGAADVNNFSLLLKELKAEFDKYGLLVTVAVAAVKQSASLSYDIPTMSQYVDYVSVMAYDMYGAWDSVTGHNAPLHKGEGDENASKDSIFSVDVALDYWLSQGCPPEKLVLGMPFYGRTFNLTNADVNGVRAPSSGAGLAGPFTVTNGLVGYNEFCVKLQTETWDVRYDTLAEVPYAVQGTNWVSYDDPNSLAKKVEYAMNLGIAGAMVWSIETDDFHGKCGEAFALLKSINKALGGSTSSTATIISSTASITFASTTAPSTTVSTTKAPNSSTTASTIVTTTAKTTTTTESTPSALCTEEGPIPNPDDCSTFFICTVRADGYFEPKLFNCPSNLVWDDNNKYCNYRYLVKC